VNDDMHRGLILVDDWGSPLLKRGNCQRSCGLLDGITRPCAAELGHAGKRNSALSTREAGRTIPFAVEYLVAGRERNGLARSRRRALGG
jgi:hypothetical protein